MIWPPGIDGSRVTQATRAGSSGQNIKCRESHRVVRRWLHVTAVISRLRIKDLLDAHAAPENPERCAIVVRFYEVRSGRRADRVCQRAGAVVPVSYTHLRAH